MAKRLILLENTKDISDKLRIRVELVCEMKINFIFYELKKNDYIKWLRMPVQLFAVCGIRPEYNKVGQNKARTV